MKQLVQHLSTGQTALEEIPLPRVGRGQVLIRTRASLVSLGTEKMLVSFGKANLLQKARSQPEKVRQVLDKVGTDGLIPTLDAVRRKLDTPLPLGYSQAGVVVSVGSGVSEFKVGDRVASNGHHAEYVCVPKNLVAHVPNEVTDEEAAFGVVGSIGLQGIRLVKPTYGETIVVVGLGLIGLVSVQLLRAHGCRVIGVDPDEGKLQRARAFGVEALHPDTSDVVQSVSQLTDGVGADGVIITASTPSNAVIKQAAQMSRKRGRIVLVGVIGLNIDRSDFYEKELTFQVSCSYGPGRYDASYEQQGNDYPIGYVRWTEQRNIGAVLYSIQQGHLDVKSLITERVPLEQFGDIYGDMNKSGSIASILEYAADVDSDKGAMPARSIKVLPSSLTSEPSDGTIAIVGAGNFTQATILPTLKRLRAPVKYLVSAGGLSSTLLAKKNSVPYSSTDFAEVLKDQEVSGVILSTRHNLHAVMTIQALEAEKHVFVEKPLCLNTHELNQISAALEHSGKTVTVGFNRRFSPHSRKMKSLLGPNPGPVSIIATMNAGYIPADHWVHDPEIGGGRIVGEACHYIDLISFLTGSAVTEVSMHGMGVSPGPDTDNASIHLKYANGSLGVINYFANGHKAYAKERIEVYCQGKTMILDNFRVLKGYGWKTGLTNTLLKTRLDKGHNDQFQELTALWAKGGSPLIPFESLVNTTRASFAAIESLVQGAAVKVTGQ